MKRKKIKAFTLAEVLITLGIVGVAAAMTIPNLITNMQNRHTEAILKEDYSILQQMMISANEDGAISNITTLNDMNEMKKWFNTFFLPYIKTENICYDKEGCWNEKVYYLNNSVFQSGGSCGGFAISFVLPNASTVCLDDYKVSMLPIYGIDANNENSIILYVDVNGQKKPNTLGKDIFVLGYDPNIGKLVPAGNSKTKTAIEKNCTKSDNGLWCLSLVKNNGWKIPKIK